MKKLFIFGIAAIALAACNGDKKAEEAAKAAADSAALAAANTSIYGKYEPTQVEGDSSYVEYFITIYDGDSVGTFRRVSTYTFGETGQKMAQQRKGSALKSQGTKNDPNAILLTLKKENSDDVEYFEMATDEQGNEIIIELAENKGRSPGDKWKNYIIPKVK